LELAFYILSYLEIPLLSRKFVGSNKINFMKILIVDDHSITRLGVSLTLKDMFPDVDITEAYDESSAIHELKMQLYDLMVFDINMPGSDPLLLLETALGLNAKMKTLVFSMVSEKTHAKHFLKKGADGFLNKDSDNTEFKNAILKITQGEKYIPESIMSNANVKRVQNITNVNLPKLSFRELEVLRRLMIGQTLTKISEETKLHISTISTYKLRIMQKLGVNSLMEIKDIPELNS